ncbi:hypothetical protein KCP76_14695 [Salmonella enterica subsp. enterica serovar Weltevreden]|nr:hypothetical protein KCP76_14695 [Salmonella enterica subsp. enterica serovar Weltevreden]
MTMVAPRWQRVVSLLLMVSGETAPPDTRSSVFCPKVPADTFDNLLGCERFETENNLMLDATGAR